MMIRGLSWDHPRGHPPMVATGAEWSATHPGIALEWTPRSLADFAGGSLAPYLGTHDLVCIDYPTIGEAAAAGWIVSLASVLHGEVVEELTAGSVDGFARPYELDGQAYAAPLDAAALCAAYRADLLETVPATVAELVAQGRETGRVAVPLSVFSCVALFFSLRAQAGAAVALAAMTELAAVVPDWCFDAGAVNLMERLTTTDDLLYVGYAYGYSTYGRADRARRATFAPAPPLDPGTSSRPTLGGVGLALLRDAPHPAEAAAYLAWVASGPIQTTRYARSGGQPAHAAAWADPGLDALTGGFFSATGPSLREAYARPNAAWFGAVQPVIGARLQDHLRGGGDPDALLTDLDRLVRTARSAHASG